VVERQQRRHPDLPDDAFADKQAEQEAKERDTSIMAPPDEEWLNFVEEDANHEVHIIPEDDDVQSKSPQADFLS
jgi:hypothetical protein